MDQTRLGLRDSLPRGTAEPPALASDATPGRFQTSPTPGPLVPAQPGAEAPQVADTERPVLTAGFAEVSVVLLPRDPHRCAGQHLCSRHRPSSSPRGLAHSPAPGPPASGPSSVPPPRWELCPSVSSSLTNLGIGGGHRVTSTPACPSLSGGNRTGYLSWSPSGRGLCARPLALHNPAQPLPFQSRAGDGEP